ncbi:hypothetical protein [Calidifontibacillus oryziterrae]|uniref:hypothetical protein n=1 Tax=Calidifontibacillus oryziterrae TaxID=1191699 RepID=UPI0002E134F1|nr:hypothetical protein [Calidifontibacillus oryziterrae]
MRGWIISNLLFIFIIIFLSFWNEEYHSPILSIGQSFAVIAVLLFLINVNMFFIFLIIKKSKRKDLKKNLALFSRKLMKAHVPIGITATAIITIHAVIMIYFHPYGVFHMKKLSGFVAICILVIHLYSGWLRRKKASGFRRKFHLRMAFVFLGFFLLHIFV